MRWSSLLLRNPANDDSYRKIEEQQTEEADVEAQNIQFIYQLEPKSVTKPYIGTYEQYPEDL